MMKKLTLTLLGLMSFAAVAADTGNIYEIKPWYSDGVQGCVTNYDYSADKPLTGGDKLWFVIRVLDSNWSTSIAGTTSLTNWTWPRYRNTGMQSESAAWAAAAPKIGIVVSGRTVGATIENIGPDEYLNSKYDEDQGGTSPYFTDIICSYTVQPGDFALPIRLAADGNGTPIDGRDNTSKHIPFIINGNLWSWYTEGSSSGPELRWEWADLQSIDYVGYRTTPEGVRRTSDYDLSQAGFFAKTIDFTNRANDEGQPRWYAAAESWRGVREGSTEVEPSFATITLTGVSSDKTTLYVWSEDDEVIKLASGEPITMKSKDGSGEIERTVYTVEFAAGEMTKTIPLQAVAAEGASTSLVLSEFKGFRTLGSGGNIPDEDYLTIPVSVIERPQPNVKVTATLTDTFAVPANPDGWKTPVGTVKLTISGGYPGDTLAVTLTPSIADGSTEAWSDYVRIAGSSANYENTDPVVFSYSKSGTSANDRKFADGEEITETVYVFGLGADSHTSVGGIKIAPTIDAAAAETGFFHDLTPLNIRLNPEVPSVAVAKVEADGNFKRRFDIKVSDNHKNTLDPRGYTISYWYTNTVTGAATDSKDLNGKWRLDGNYTLVSVDDATVKPEISFTPGRYIVYFNVVTPGDPVGDVLSTEGSTNISVSEPARANAVIVLDTGTTAETGKYDESDESTISVKVALSAQYPDANLWAFLAPVAGSGTAERSGGSVVTNAETTIGMKIEMGRLESEVGGLLVIDGKGGTGSILSYDIVLCTSEQFNANNIVSSYQSQTFKLTVNNVAPVISDVNLNGFPMNEFEGHNFTRLIPAGRSNVIKPEINDVIADIKGDMILTLNARSDSGDLLTPVTITNSTDTMTAEFKNVVFNTEGKWTAKIKATDKDGGKSNEYTFTFNVREPSVTIGSATSYFEEYVESATSATLPLSLSFYDSAAADGIVVKVTVKPPTGSNPGRFVLDEAYRNDIDGYPELAENEYYVPFKAATTENMRIVEMDGTSRSSANGFTIEAKVVNEGLATQYPAVSKKVYVRNIAPQFSSSVAPQNTETNAFAVGRELSWSINANREVAADLTNSWQSVDISGNKVTTNGVRVTVTGCANESVFFVTDASTYKFKPEFDNGSTGVQTVMMMIEDKDGGSGEALTYYYEVPLYKTLVTGANGPSGGSADIPLSQLYISQKGIGRGHVFVPEMNWQSASDFAITWYCNPSLTKVVAYAYGYSVGDVDDGMLDYDVAANKSRDVAIDRAGNREQGSETPSNPYVYTDGMNKDSFLYGWLQSDEADGNEYTMRLNIDVNPDRRATTRINLATDPTKDGAGYLQTYAEAVFSKEYSPYDNMGDINQDGVPDYYALMKYPLAVNDGVGGDLADVGSQSDGDRLPDATNLGRLRVLPGTWITNSQPFTAKYEIRGFGEGLNYGMFQFDEAEATAGWVSDLQLTDNEKISLLAHAIRRRDEIFQNWVDGKRDIYAGFDPSGKYSEDGDFAAITNLLGTTIRYNTSYFGDNNATVPAYLPYECPTNDTIAVGTVSELTITTDVVMLDGTTNKVENTGNYWLYDYTDRNWNEVTVTNLVEAITNITKRGATATTNVYWKSASDKITVGNINISDWLNNETPEAYAAAMAAAKRYIDRSWVPYREEVIKRGESKKWGWTCENRTDPTKLDTDGDGMSDAFEYFFWYDAAIGVVSATGNYRLTGSAFDPDDITSYDKVITSEQIAEIFNPNIPRVWTAQDTDGDGIYDLEEFLIGTSPVHWDTDRDALSDFYELTYEMKPLSDDSDMNADGDFMAYVSSTNQLSALAAYKYIYTATNGTIWALDTNVKAEMKLAVELAKAYGYETNVFEISGAKGFKVARYCGEYIPTTLDTANFENSENIVSGMFGTDKFYVVPAKGLMTDPDSVSVALFHRQVYNYYGFNPLTAWSCGDDGNIAAPLSRKVAAVNTRAYAAKYEYTLHAFLNAVGIPVFGEFNKPTDLIRSRMTNPTTSRVLSTTETITTTTTVNEETGETTSVDTTETEEIMSAHGADSDGDGVPDGWELYIGVNPCIAYGAKDESALSYEETLKGVDEADKMGLAEEFAGTDSCAAYSDCATIYRLHPSQGNPKTNAHYRWYNKFWPTDPRSSDTDGDHLPDNLEHGEWGETFTFNRFGDVWSDVVWHYSIYGEPFDYGDKCIAGGGLNPCSIDTDLDGLPDPWEYQYAGVIFYQDKVAVASEENNIVGSFHGAIPDESFGHDDFEAELSMGSWYWRLPRSASGAIVSQYYIMMGMDGTVADATTYDRLFANNDWDGDGLENWQEYMVQSLRHLRYDDDKTPLLGRDSPLVTVVNEASGRCEYEPGEWCADALGDGTNRFLKTSYAMPFSNTQLEFIGDKLGYKNFASWAMNPGEYSGYADYLAALGYFSAPPRSWDPASNYKYMLPRAKPSKYYRTSKSTNRELTGYEYKGQPYVKPEYEPELPDPFYRNGKYYGYMLTTDGTPYYTEIKPVYGEVSTGYRLYQYDYTSSVSGTILDVGYFSSDPRLWDTDNDGMDDYYELFHGLNPILGAVTDSEGYVYNSDIIARAFYGRISPWNNAWTGWNEYEKPVCDPIKTPWMMGTAMADADGDGLRNNEEMILANVTDPGSTHTDPTPLWMTDSSVSVWDEYVYTEEEARDENGYNEMVEDEDGNLIVVMNRYGVYEDIGTYKNVPVTVPLVGGPSYTALYYSQANVSSYLNNSDDLMYLMAGSLMWNSSSYEYLTPFEENEGYDTDNDWRSDSVEAKNTSEPTSDPQDFADPARRQSIWFGGPDDPGVAVTTETSMRWTDNFNLYRQFTVEAWVRPENATGPGDKVVACRACRYDGWDADNTNRVIRLNFAIGIDGDGNAFALTQNSTTNECRITGDTVADGKWTHLASTYDGACLKLYVNGRCVNSIETDIIPANGAERTRQDGQSLGEIEYRSNVKRSATMIGARPAGDGAFGWGYTSRSSSWDDVATSFLKGSVDEVRFWEGARTEDQIVELMNTRIDTDKAKELRSDVFKALGNGARRNNNDGARTGDLPAELVQHYSFATLAGAAAPEYVQQVPPGFINKVLGVIRDPNDSSSLSEIASVSWWKKVLSSPVGSSIYKSEYVVPWIEDTISHLPALCGIVEDSVYWSENFAGYTGAEKHGYEKYVFPNTMNPYTKVTYNGLYSDENYTDAMYNLEMKLRWVENYTNTASLVRNVYGSGTLYELFRYDLEHGIIGCRDLIPLGSAFANRLTLSWDGSGVEDAWAVTTDGTGEDGDTDGDGLADWWEERYGDKSDIDPTSIVERDGVSMKASEAYIRDLAAGMVPDGETGEIPEEEGVAKFKDTADVDKDGIPDWWENLYDIFPYGADYDSDRDGISNYQEYMIHEVYGLEPVSPTLAISTHGQRVTDYFLRYGKLYYGELFADHDHIEDWWEADMPTVLERGAASIANYSQFTYDANRVVSNDGWNNWEIARAWFDGSYETNIVSTTADGMVVTNTYVTSTVADRNGSLNPKVKIHVSYSGKLGNLGYKGREHTIVVKAWGADNANDPNMTGSPDKIWSMVAKSQNSLDMSGVAQGYDLTAGSVRPGRSMFVAYAVPGVLGEDDEAPGYTAGMPFGVAFATIGALSGGTVDIEMTDFSPSMMRIDLATAIEMQKAYYLEKLATKDGDWWTNVLQEENTSNKAEYYSDMEAAYQLMKSTADRGIQVCPWATLQRSPDYCATNLFFAASNSVQVWVAQMLINGERNSAGKYYKPLFSLGTVDLTKHPVITEADLASYGYYDLGWYTLTNSYKSAGKRNISDLTSATFGLIIEENPAKVYPDANNTLLVEMVNHYEAGVSQTPVSGKEVRTYSGAPTFSWTHQNSIGKDYPAFRLKVWKEDGSTLVFDSGVQRAPVRDASGRYNWTAPLWVGSMTAENVVFNGNEKYTWDVSMLDAKFTGPLDSDKSKFMMQDTSASPGESDYGIIPVKVKYLGPGSVATDSATKCIRVEAYTSPEFSGTPVGVGYVTDLTALDTTGEIVQNAVIKGLSTASKYYVLAYLDTNGNLKREDWESWGYACYYASAERDDFYTPRAFEAANAAATDDCVVYIEDADTNCNMVPDVLEYEMNAAGNNMLTPYIAFTASNEEKINAIDNATEGTNGKASSLKSSGALFAYESAMNAMASGAPTLAEIAVATGAMSLETSDSVHIKIATFSLEEGITLEVTVDDAFAQLIANGLDTGTVKVAVEHATTLADGGDWTSAGGAVSVSFPLTAGTTDIPASALAPINDAIEAVKAANGEGGYFRIKVVAIEE